MKFILINLTIICLFLFNNIGAEELDGSWLFIGEQLDSKSAECPELIVFSKGTYKVLNDCYGTDMRNPVIETGFYTLDNDQTKISFNRQEPVSEYFLHTLDSVVTFTFERKVIDKFCIKGLLNGNKFAQCYNLKTF
jgi:hypothetical protein